MRSRPELPPRSWSRAAAAAIVAVVVSIPIASCDDGDVEVPTPPQATPAVDRIVAEVCDAVFRCCDRGEASFVLGPYVGVDDCQTRLLQRSTVTAAALELAAFAGPTIHLPNLAGLESAVADRRVAIDGEALDACVAYLAELACSTPTPATDDEGACAAPPAIAGSTPCDVLDLFVGAVPEGGTCTSGLLSLECSAGLGCARDIGAGIDGQCVPVGDVGDPCFTDAECGVHVRDGDLAPELPRREKLYCSQADGTCQLLRRAGETCLQGSELPDLGDAALIRCVPGLSCDPVSDLCVPPCARGAACDVDAACDEEADLLCIAGRCDLRRSEGAPCAEPADCDEGLACTADASGAAVCARRLDDGAPCLGHGDCESGFCEPESAQCAPQVEPGGLCPSGDSAQCELGLCTSDFSPCNDDSQCPGSNACDLEIGQCASYCVALKPDGATCLSPAECGSQQCIAGFCRTPPLEDGVACDLDEQCDAMFCSPGPERVCTALPLALGEACTASLQCASEVCFQDPGSPLARCITGLEQGESCGAAGQPPCSPLSLYCDHELAAPVCVPLRGTGEDCDSPVQCRGECALRFNRTMCFPPDDPTSPLCDGAAIDPILGDAPGAGRSDR